MASSELVRIRVLTRLFAPESPSAASGVQLGIGDDAAVLAPSAEPLVWTIDAAVDGVHFRRAWLSFEDIGYRSTMAAVSDLAAMAAEPLGVLSALVLPEDVTDDDLFALARGQKEAASAAGTAVIGGNLARGRELSITTTALGRTPRPFPRGGARPGDVLWLLGPVGLAAAGLRFLQRSSLSRDVLAEDGARDVARSCVAAWRRPRALLAGGLSLRGVASAAVDVSDGLARDVGHLARASGVVAVIETAALEDAPDLRAAAEALGASALDLALFGGEDYAIAFTAAPGARVPSAVEIGRIEAPAGGQLPGVVARRPDGSREPLGDGGFDHFAR